MVLLLSSSLLLKISTVLFIFFINVGRCWWAGHVEIIIEGSSCRFRHMHGICVGQSMHMDMVWCQQCHWQYERHHLHCCMSIVLYILIIVYVVIIWCQFHCVWYNALDFNSNSCWCRWWVSSQFACNNS